MTKLPISAWRGTPLRRRVAAGAVLQARLARNYPRPQVLQPVDTLVEALVLALIEVVDNHVDAVLVADEVVVEESVGLVARELPHTEVAGALQRALADLDALCVVAVDELIVVEDVVGLGATFRRVRVVLDGSAQVQGAHARDRLAIVVDYPFDEALLLVPVINKE